MVKVPSILLKDVGKKVIMILSIFHHVARSETGKGD
jgi:hypothetical protein